ncbi:MAG: DUF1800 domain-containing protein [Burkholderiales bacterium]|nr:DUF1800 domain-containing protein [Burkholderiales bacterium]MDE2566698.1 DUF1800 domain-containing protein [Burkholderiales bacterium]
MDRPDPTPATTLDAAIAAQRFGLGEADLTRVGPDPRGWLAAQIGPAAPQVGAGLASGADALRVWFDLMRERRERRRQGPQSEAAAVPARPEPLPAEHRLRDIVQADLHARLATAVATPQPFNERLALFWANHFTVSLAKGNTRGLVGAFEREAIRPHIGGSFETLLKAAVHHGAMLRYLDNDNSAGPDSRVVQRLALAAERRGNGPPRLSGLNENLAREVMELHTLGASGGGQPYGGWGDYDQRDVTAFARVLTGWRLPLRELQDGTLQDADGRFDPAWHEPGEQTVLGQRYGAGPQALDQVLHALATHRSTAHFVCMKLARHFVADEPPPALVARLAASWQASAGDLPTVYRTLLASPEAWQPQPTKLKTPEEFAVSSLRLLGGGPRPIAARPDLGIGTMGQRVQAAPSPAGWPDTAADWLGPDAVWKRIEWAHRVAALAGRQTDARLLAQAGLGARLQPETLRQIDRAADGPQALALLLMAPEFQRR